MPPVMTGLLFSLVSCFFLTTAELFFPMLSCDRKLIDKSFAGQEFNTNLLINLRYSLRYTDTQQELYYVYECVHVSSRCLCVS